MPVTNDEVLRHLQREEPDYANAAQMGPEAMPHLLELAKTADPLLASKATYLASQIRSADSMGVLEAANERADPEVRVAAAAGVRNLTAASGGNAMADLVEVDPDGFRRSVSSLLDKMLNDDDAGVRKHALKAAEATKAPGLRDKVESLSVTDPLDSIREIAKRTKAVLPTR